MRAGRLAKLEALRVYALDDEALGYAGVLSHIAVPFAKTKH